MVLCGSFYFNLAVKNIICFAKSPGLLKKRCKWKIHEKKVEVEEAILNDCTLIIGTKV